MAAKEKTNENSGGIKMDTDINDSIDKRIKKSKMLTSDYVAKVWHI